MFKQWRINKLKVEIAGIQSNIDFLKYKIEKFTPKKQYDFDDLKDNFAKLSKLKEKLQQLQDK